MSMVANTGLEMLTRANHIARPGRDPHPVAGAKIAQAGVQHPGPGLEPGHHLDRVGDLVPQPQGDRPAAHHVAFQHQHHRGAALVAHRAHGNHQGLAHGGRCQPALGKHATLELSLGVVQPDVDAHHARTRVGGGIDALHRPAVELGAHAVDAELDLTAHSNRGDVRGRHLGRQFQAREVDQGQHTGIHRELLARLGVALGHDARHGRDDAGVGQGLAGQLQLRLGGGDIGLGHGQRTGGGVGGVAGDEVLRQQLFVGRPVLAGQVALRLGAGKRRPALGEPGAQLGIVDLREQLTGGDALALARQHLDQFPGDLGLDHGLVMRLQRAGQRDGRLQGCPGRHGDIAGGQLHDPFGDGRCRGRSRRPTALDHHHHRGDDACDHQENERSAQAPARHRQRPHARGLPCVSFAGPATAAAAPMPSMVMARWVLR